MTKFTCKKLLSLFVVLCMILTLLPMNSMRVQAGEADSREISEESGEVKTASGVAITMTKSMSEEPFNIRVGNKEIISTYTGDITGDGIVGTVTYDSDTNTLTLNNATITEANTGTIIYSEESLNIKLEGLNVLINEDDIISGNAIYCANGGLTLSGNYGSLVLYGARVTGGLYAGEDINILSGTYDITSIREGIYALGNINISDGTVSIKVESSSARNWGITCEHAVNISGGTVDITAKSTATDTGMNEFISAYGIEAKQGVFISGGKVKITAETTTVLDAATYGIYSYAEISDGSVNVTARSVSQDNDSGTYGILWERFVKTIFVSLAK